MVAPAARHDPDVVSGGGGEAGSRSDRDGAADGGAVGSRSDSAGAAGGGVVRSRSDCDGAAGGGVVGSRSDCDGAAGGGVVGSRSDCAGAAGGGMVGSGRLADTAAVGREARRTSHGRRHLADVVATVLLLVLLAVESVAAGGGIVFLSMAFHSCAAPGNSCNAGLGTTVVHAGPVIVACVLVVTLLVCTLRLVRRRLAWPVALVGIAAQVVVFSAALLLVDSAVQHGF